MRVRVSGGCHQNMDKHSNVAGNIRHPFGTELHRSGTHPFQNLTLINIYWHVIIIACCCWES